MGLATLPERANIKNFKVHLQNILILFLLVTKCLKVEDYAKIIANMLTLVKCCAIKKV